MYANLLITVDGTAHSAWQYTDVKGKKTVYLDANEEGSYAEPAGELDVSDARAIEITADF